MGKHKHEGEITFDKKLRCRLCGEEVDSYEEVISTEISGKRALRIMREIAEAGGYMVANGSPDFPLYIKVTDGLVVEVTVRKIENREYEVVKRVHYREVIDDVKRK